MRSLLLTVACAAAAAHAGRGSLRQQDAAPTQLPHILLLFTDEQDGRTLDPNHPFSRVATTPTFDHIASTGTNFVRTYTPSPQCVPGRVATFTSLETHHTQAWSNGKGLAADPKTGELDSECVRLYSTKTCTQWAEEQAKKVHTTLDRELESLGWNVTLVGKVDVGATILQRFPLAWANGYHSGPSPGILTRGADVRRPTKGAPISLVNWNKPNGSFPNDWVTIENTVELLDNFNKYYKPDERVFLYSSVLTPHPPLHTSSKWLDLVNDTLARQNLPKWNAWDSYHPYDSYMSISKNFAGDQSYSEDYLFNISISYFSDVALADYMHTQVYDAFKRSPMANNSFVIFIADHGEAHGEHRQMWKNTMYESSSRVPFAIAGPGIKAQQVTMHTSLLDVMPTIIELAGGTVPDGLDGQSLVPMLFEDEATARSLGVTWSGASSSSSSSSSSQLQPTRPVYSQYHSNMGNTGAFALMQTMQDGSEVKLVAFGHSFSWFNASAYVPQLFNLTADPDELHNVAAEQPELTATLMQQLEDHFDGSLQAIDQTVMRSQQQLFQQYFVDVYDNKQLRSHLERTYKGFDDEDMKKVNAYLAATPGTA